MQNQVDHFQLLRQERAALEHIGNMQGAVGYFAQEALRFYSIAGSLIDNNMLGNTTVEERQFTHILGRSLMEGFFWLVYIFDDPAQRAARYQEKVEAFQREYGRFWNEPHVPERPQLEPAGAAWAGLPSPRDINTLLTQVVNDHGTRLNYLYLLYRIASFDTHGNSMNNLFQSAFGRAANFATLNFTYGFDLIANHYLVILQELRAAREVPLA
jgi:hypothetical protein